MRPAVFLDRDGTLLTHVHHLRDPADVELIEGANGVFEVEVDNKLIFSKSKLRRFPEPGEIAKLIK